MTSEAGKRDRIEEIAERLWKRTCDLSSKRGIAEAERILREELRELVEAARDGVDAINDELQAAGADEVAQHPTLKRHQKIHKRLAKVLEGFES